jgi:hypothetical protein
VCGVEQTIAGVAQLVEQLTCNQQVDGSNPPASSERREVVGTISRLWVLPQEPQKASLRDPFGRIPPSAQSCVGIISGTTVLPQETRQDFLRDPRGKMCPPASRCTQGCFLSRRRVDSDGQVAKWLNASDCKSDGSCLRRFESFPAHRSVLSWRLSIDNCLRE